MALTSDYADAWVLQGLKSNFEIFDLSELALREGIFGHVNFLPCDTFDHIYRLPNLLLIADLRLD